MAVVAITLTRFATTGSVLTDAVVIASTINTEDFDLEVAFQAANRIESNLADDLAALHSDWARDLRKQLDATNARSMMPGDRVDLVSDAGTTIGSWLCDSFGWTHIVGAR